MNPDDLHLVEEYSETTYDEFGEMLRTLLSLYNDHRDYCSEKILNTVTEELTELAQYIRENYEKIEETETTVIKRVRWREIE